MPPTKSQLCNLASMVAEIGVENVVEMAIKSAGGYPMDERIMRGATGVIRKIEESREAACRASEFLHQLKRGESHE